MDFTKIFVDVDDFWKQFQPAYQQRLLIMGLHQRQRDSQLSMGEIMTLLIAFQSRICFKTVSV